jgi:hypothetical protein
MRHHGIVAAGIALALAGQSAQASEQVRLTGRSAADDELQTDIVRTITLYGSAFHCPAPSVIAADLLNAASVPVRLRPDSPDASFEEWDATFCGKKQRFFVSFWPDPKGGSFLSVQYPYPADAPRAAVR